MARCAPQKPQPMEPLDMLWWPGPLGSGGNDEPGSFNQGSLANGFPHVHAHFEAGIDSFIKPASIFTDDPASHGLPDLPLAWDDLIHHGPDLSPSNSPDASHGYVEDIWHSFSGLVAKENDVMAYSEYMAWPVGVHEQLIESKAAVLDDESMDELLAALMAYDGDVVVPLQPAAPAAKEEPSDQPMPPALTAPQPDMSPPPPKEKPARRRAPPKAKGRKMSERKRDQNKRAAGRYRSKKRQLEEQALDSHQALLRERDELCAARKKLQDEIHMALGLIDKRLRRIK